MPNSGHEEGENNRRGGRVAEGARLESVYTGDRIGGSNPFLSAERKLILISVLFFKNLFKINIMGVISSQRQAGLPLRCEKGLF